MSKFKQYTKLPPAERAAVDNRARRLRITDRASTDSVAPRRTRFRTGWGRKK